MKDAGRMGGLRDKPGALNGYVDVVFDGPPGPEAGRFVEVEDESGASIKLGEWVERDDGYWVLRIPRTEDTDGQ